MELERTGRLPHGGFEKPIADEKILPSGRKPVEKEYEKPLKKSDHVNLSETEEKTVKSPPKEPPVEVIQTVDGEQILKRKKVPNKSKKKAPPKKESTAKKTSTKKSLKRRIKK